MSENTSISSNTSSVELRVDPSLAPSVLRAFLGATPKDSEIDNFPIPKGQLWLTLVVYLLRLYRRVRPKSIGQRCVFDPSCSRYSEMAFRNYGFVKGGYLTISRLHRCRPGVGGTDLP